jgi:hypothetical protein
MAPRAPAEGELPLGLDELADEFVRAVDRLVADVACGVDTRGGGGSPPPELAEVADEFVRALDRPPGPPPEIRAAALPPPTYGPPPACAWELALADVAASLHMYSDVVGALEVAATARAQCGGNKWVCAQAALLERLVAVYKQVDDVYASV